MIEVEMSNLSVQSEQKQEGNVQSECPIWFSSPKPLIPGPFVNVEHYLPKPMPFERMTILAKAASRILGIPVELRPSIAVRTKRQHWDGEDVRGVFARANTPSSAAAEMREDLWRTKIVPERKRHRF